MRWRTPGCKTCQEYVITKVGTLQDVEYEFSLQQSLTRCGRLRRRRDLLDTGADDARNDHEAKRHKDDALPMEQEPSSSSGVKRANVEAIRRADAEAEKALKRARVLDERRAAKRVSAAPEEMETMLVAAEAILAETRETVEALTVSALQPSS